MTGQAPREGRNDAAISDPPTDQEVADLVTRAGDLLDELRATFADIQTLLQQDTP